MHLLGRELDTNSITEVQRHVQLQAGQPTTAEIKRVKRVKHGRCNMWQGVKQVKVVNRGPARSPKENPKHQFCDVNVVTDALNLNSAELIGTLYEYIHVYFT